MLGIDILDRCLEELGKKENQKKIKINILEPVMSYILSKIWPYFLFMIILISITVSGTIFILFKYTKIFSAQII